MSDRNLNRTLNRAFFSKQSRSKCWRLIAGLLDIGVDLPKALEMVEISVAAQGEKAARDVLIDIRKAVRVGQGRSRLMYYAKGSDALILSQMGRVDPSLMFKGAHRILDLENRIQKAIMGALIQPIILLVILTGFMFMMGTRLFPILTQFLDPNTWNFRVKILYNISTSIVENWITVAVGVLVAFFVISFLQSNLVGALRQFLDKMPPFSIYKIVTSASFFIMLTELARAGISISRSELETVARNCRVYEKKHIRHIARNLQVLPLGEALWRGSDNWPDLELRAISKIYGSRSDGLANISDYLDQWIERAEERIQASARIVNVVMLIAFAALIATIGQFIYVDIPAGMKGI